MKRLVSPAGDTRRLAGFDFELGACRRDGWLTFPGPWMSAPGRAWDRSGASRAESREEFTIWHRTCMIAERTLLPLGRTKASVDAEGEAPGPRCRAFGCGRSPQ